jgi:hypothetical protein
VEELRSPLLWVLVAAATALVVQSWRLGRQRTMALANQGAAIRESVRKVAAEARTLRASEGEAGAFALLERAGYAVLERQVPGSWTVRADGEALTFGLRADYLVEHRGRRYIAEVKTGRLAPRLSHGPTRRQLLEYRAAFDVHGVVLVDADAGSIVHVDIDLFSRDGRVGDGASGRTQRPSTVALVAAVFLVVGIVVGAALHR